MHGGRWIPNDLYEMCGKLIAMGQEMHADAKHRHQTQPSASGLYAVAMVMDAQGDSIHRMG